MKPRFATGICVLGLLIVAWADNSQAEAVRFEITRREPFAAGESFGATGAYEIIAGRVHFALDPKLPQNANVVDLPLATRNDAGKVEFWADLFVLTPADPTKG